MADGSFRKPEFYNFPPFFTLQPVLATRRPARRRRVLGLVPRGTRSPPRGVFAPLLFNIVCAAVTCVAYMCFEADEEVVDTLEVLRKKTGAGWRGGSNARRSSLGDVTIGEKQLRLWCDMILRWHHARKEYTFAWKEWPLWENSAIGRKLGEEGAKAVVDELIRTGNAEWSDAGKSMVTLMWHSTDEIAAKLFDFVRKNGMIGNVFTVYELHQGDDVLGTDFHGMEEGLFRKALAVLEDQGRAVIFQGATSEEDGVKFLA